jgi:hypothetical protein
MSKIKIHTVETGEIIEREMNAEELAQWEIDKEKAKEIDKAKAETERLKEAEKQEILDKLGITAEQAKLLLS